MQDDDFDQAFRELYPAARRLAYRILGDAEAAEDVASEALVRTLMRWPKVRDLAYRDGWVMRVTTNLAIDVARRRKLHVRAMAGEAPVSEQALESYETEVTVLRAALVEALIRLPRRQREAIVLVHLLDYSTNDAANAMRVSPSSVGQHIRRGMAQMKTRLAADDLPPDLPLQENPTNAIN
jgi:RNA polymerase sigma factor (sigma-70 family)